MGDILLQIHYERKAEKFFNKGNISRDEVSKLIIRAVKKLTGQSENIDVKRLKGEYNGYLRIRKGDLRIVFRILEEENLFTVFVNNIDLRGNIYK